MPISIETSAQIAICYYYEGKYKTCFISCSCVGPRLTHNFQILNFSARTMCVAHYSIKPADHAIKIMVNITLFIS